MTGSIGNEPDALTSPSALPENSFSLGTIECAIGDWFFRYRIVSEGVIQIAQIYYSPDNLKHGLYDLTHPRQ